MKEIREILKETARLATGEKAVLATVVDLKGSGYRLPGARMLIKRDGGTVGTVSGGCLEADVMERAKRVIATGKPEVFVYDTTADEASVFSLNMGCRGLMRILLEPVDAESEIVSALRRSYEGRETIACALAIAAGNGFAVGDRFFAGIDEPPIEGLAEDLQATVGGNAGFRAREYSTEADIAEFAFERMGPPVRLIVLGAGADAVPLADAAFALGWQTRCIDHRPAFLTRERFADADELILIDGESEPAIDADDMTAIVVMNHNYDRDKRAFAAALRSRAFYVGMLGPKKRTQQIIDELGQPISENEMSRLRSPTGLDIGGDSPESIAVAIAAEIQSVLKQRHGGPLRDRDAPIYDRK